MNDDRTPHIPSDDELTEARSNLESMLGGSGIDLSDASLWEPAPDLADTIVAEAVGSSRGAAKAAIGWRSYWLAAAAVAAIVAIGVTAIRFAAADPDWRVELAATELAPGAEASIDGWNEPSGTRVRLDIDGLPPAPDGFFYELWFSAGPQHISAGTFRDTEGVEMWAGVTRADFPRLWITLEPIDDDESPSGDTVLDTGSRRSRRQALRAAAAARCSR